MNSVGSKLCLEILIINTSFLHLLFCKQVKNGIASVSLTYQRAIRTIHWIWTNANIGFWKFHIVEWLQEVSVTFLSYTIDNEHLLSVPLLIVVRVLTIVVRRINKANVPRQISLSKSSTRHMSSSSKGIVIIKTESSIDNTLSLLFQSNGCFKWHHSFPIFFI